VTSPREVPQPKVLFLSTIFRSMREGFYRVPAFQRDFVWEEKQVLELLESVYRGFPIGSALMWRVNEPILKVDHSGRLPLPVLETSRYPIEYVLDGLQRLTTLYACFHQEEHSDGRFAAVFDLRNRIFEIRSPEGDPGAYLRLSDILDAKRLVGSQQRLITQTDGEDLVDASTQLFSAFQEYTMPIVSIAETDVATVVKIFERVNSTGTRLGRVDFMRAVTWSEEFDLEPQLALMADGARDRGFDIPDETLIKLLGLGMGLEPTAESLIELRQKPATELFAARETAMEGLSKALEFLQQENVFGYDYVPYEGQLIVATGFFIENPEPRPESLEILTFWYRSVALAEFLRGKPDHYVSRALDGFRDEERLRIYAPVVRLDLRPDDLLSRRFMVGKALSAGIAMLFASRPPRDIVSGQIIEPIDFMRFFEPSHFVSIAERNDLEQLLGRKPPSARVIANIVVVSDASRSKLRTNKIAALSSADPEVLASQLVSETAMAHLVDGDVTGFLRQRAHDMHSVILEYVGQI